MKRIRTRYAVMNALFVGALLSTGCPKSGPGTTITSVKVPTAGGTKRPTTPGANPGATQPKPDPLPPGQPDGPVPQIPPVQPPVVTDPNKPITQLSSFLGGLVTAPASIISNNGGAIISNNGSAIISNAGSGIISNNGGAIISNNGGAIISNAGSGYRIFEASGPEGVLKNAFLYLTNRDEKFYLNTKTNQVFTAVTDNAGAYRFDIAKDNGFPVTKDVVVNALINGNLRMTGYIAPVDGENQLKLNLATTLATEYLRGHAYRNGKSLKSYNRDQFYNAATLTQRAIEAGDIEAVKTMKNQDGADLVRPNGTKLPIGQFDLRIDHVFNLRNQYTIALSAIDLASAKASTIANLKAISDLWKSLLGARPMAVTTFAGNGGFATVSPQFDGFGAPAGHVTGDGNPATQVPLGFTYDVDVYKPTGDTFVCGYSEAASSGFVRWIKPNGTVTSLWLPSFGLVKPLSVAVEYGPGERTDGKPGSVLVVDQYYNRVVRIYLVEAGMGTFGPDNYYEQYPMEIVAGYETPFTPGADGSYVAGRDFPIYSDKTMPEHPLYVDCKRDADFNPTYDDGSPMVDPMAPDYNLDYYFSDYKSPYQYTPVDTSNSVTPEKSRWRLGDEGVRKYVLGNSDATKVGVDALAIDAFRADHFMAPIPHFKADDEIPNPARFATLNQPTAVEVDNDKNIYIADKANHRVRMIPAKDGMYFGYHQPTDGNSDNIIDSYGPEITMKKGCIYTIAGNPTWDNGKSPNIGGYWFGEFLLGGAPSDNKTDRGAAQKAHLDQPYALAFDDTKKVLYISDSDNQRIRAVSRDTGFIWTAAGTTDPMAQVGDLSDRDFDYAPADLTNGKTGGDGGPATAASLSYPRGITVDDATGKLFIADNQSGRIRMVDGAGVITTIAGRTHDITNPNKTDNVTDGDALLWADLWDTEGLALDKFGNLLLSDFRHNRVRKVWRQWD